MPNYFRVKDLPGFEDLIVKTDEVKEDWNNILAIDAFFDTSDNTTVDLPTGSVFIANTNLEPISFYDFAKLVEDDKVEVDTNTLFGAYLYEGNFIKGSLNITYTMYEKAVSITIFEFANKGKTQHTLFTQNFFDESRSAMHLIEDVMVGNMDSDDLIFSLKDLKASELDGDK